MESWCLLCEISTVLRTSQRPYTDLFSYYTQPELCIPGTSPQFCKQPLFNNSDGISVQREHLPKHLCQRTDANCCLGAQGSLYPSSLYKLPPLCLEKLHLASSSISSQPIVCYGIPYSKYNTQPFPNQCNLRTCILCTWTVSIHIYLGT